MGLIGYVIGTQMAKTVKVRVPREIYVKKYKKIVTKHKNYFAHDEEGRCLVGDIVHILPTKRFSLMKSHAVASVVQPAERFVDDKTGLVFTNGHLNIPVGRMTPEGDLLNRFKRNEYKTMGLL